MRAERWHCSPGQALGACTNSRTISTPQLEQRLLGSLKGYLLQPKRVAAFVAAYHRARKEERLASASARAEVECAWAKVTGRIGRPSAVKPDAIGDLAEMKA